MPLQEIPFNIQKLEGLRLHNAPKHEIAPIDPHFGMIWLRAGRGTLTIDERTWLLQYKTLYCVMPGQIHLLRLDEQAEGYFLSLTERLMTRGNDEIQILCGCGLSRLLQLLPGNALLPETAAEIDYIFKKLYLEAGKISLLRTEMITRYITILLIHLARHFESSLRIAAPNRNETLVNAFFGLVEKKYAHWRLVKDYAGELCVSPNYLNETVKKLSGFPASHHIRQRVVLEARRRAAGSNVSMKEIAYLLGFEDTSHFSKFFKTTNGQSFTDFKKIGVSL